jgi:hypothetical protein
MNLRLRKERQTTEYQAAEYTTSRRNIKVDEL